MKSCAVIPAAGRGTRLGRHGPKILTPLSPTENIWSILRRKLLDVVDHVHVVLSPDGEPLFRREYQADIATGRVSTSVQSSPIGMGDAIFCGYDVWSKAELLLVIWGDQVFVSRETLAGAVAAHGREQRKGRLAGRRSGSRWEARWAR